MEGEVRKAVKALYDPQSTPQIVRDSNEYLIRVFKSNEAERLCHSMLDTSSNDREAFFAATMLSKLQIRHIDRLCRHIIKYTGNDLVHKPLCLAFARQKNVSVQKIFGGKEALVTTLRILSNVSDPNPNDEFARAVYVRCICPNVELPRQIPTP